MIAANGENRRALALAFAWAFVTGFGTKLGELTAEHMKSLVFRGAPAPRTPPGPPPTP